MIAYIKDIIFTEITKRNSTTGSKSQEYTVSDHS